MDGQRKHIALVHGGDTPAAPYASAAAALDAGFSTCRAAEMQAVAAQVDCLVCAVPAQALEKFAVAAEKLLDEHPDLAALFSVPRECVAHLRLPASSRADFIAAPPDADELALRLRRLLWPGQSSAASDHISIDGMSINLATYQVKVDGEPVDFTYLEYALLAFLVTHPGHVFSRDVLLSRVWGFDYYGGSRTVDVHVRRVRAKLGTQLAARLETVRGVGYMWSM